MEIFLEKFKLIHILVRLKYFQKTDFETRLQLGIIGNLGFPKGYLSRLSIISNILSMAFAFNDLCAAQMFTKQASMTSSATQQTGGGRTKRLDAELCFTSKWLNLLMLKTSFVVNGLQASDRSDPDGIRGTTTS